MAGTISLQAVVERNEMRFERGTVTYTTTSNVSDAIALIDSDWGAPDFVIYEPVTAGCKTNEEQVSLGTYSNGTQILQRDGTSTLTSGGVFNYMLVWTD